MFVFTFLHLKYAVKAKLNFLLKQVPFMLSSIVVTYLVHICTIINSMICQGRDYGVMVPNLLLTLSAAGSKSNVLKFYQKLSKFLKYIGLELGEKIQV